MRYEWRDAACRSTFAKSDATPKSFRNDPDLAAAWAFDHSVTTVEMVVRCRHRVDGELSKIGEEWSLSDSFTNVGRGKAAARAPRAPSALAAVALRMT